MLLTIITFILVLSVLVFAHELGHFWMARRFGVKAEEFGFGFPPRAIGYQTWREDSSFEGEVVNGQKKKGKRKWRMVYGGRALFPEEEKYGTVYSLNWIPLGGFVKIKGENGEGENDPDSFSARPAWQRVFILSAGVSMNVILAGALISLGLMVGMPQSLNDLGASAKISDQKIQVAEVLKDSPAEKAGLKIGDIILSINNQTFRTETELQNYVGTRKDQELTYQIKRGDKEEDFKIAPKMQSETGRAGVGIAITATGVVRYPWYIAIWEGFKIAIFLVWAIIVAFYTLIKNLIFGHGLNADVAGPVGIATMTGQAARMGWVYVLQFTALLSVNLAVINFLPFPALDGGRVLFIIVEKIKGKPVRRELEATMHYIGFALLLLLVAVVTFRDVLRIWTQ